MAKIYRLPGHQKQAASMEQTISAAITGAISGALVGSRRSLDDKMVQGMIQGAITGALAGGAAAQGTKDQRVHFAAGAAGGYLGSRGPNGPSRPQLHVRVDNGEKMAADVVGVAGFKSGMQKQAFARVRRAGAAIKRTWRSVSPEAKGTVIGGGLGAVYMDRAVKRENDKLIAKGKEPKYKRGINVATGAVLGGITGHNIGSMARMLGGAGSQQRARQSRGGYAGYQARNGARPGVPKDFWAGMDPAISRRVKGVATHAKRTTGPEGEVAKTQLRTLAKKHGLDYEELIKQANVKAKAKMLHSVISARTSQAKGWVKRNPWQTAGGVLIGGGALAGGHDRYDRSTRKSTETESRFRYRRLRNTLTGAVRGAGAGAGVLATAAIVKDKIK